jgi:hypothetical protein
VGAEATVDGIGVDATLGAQAVIIIDAATINRLNKRLVNILISFSDY